MGFTGISTDMFPHCAAGLRFVRRREYVPVGSYQACAYVNGLGLTESLAFYKDLTRVEAMHL